MAAPADRRRINGPAGDTATPVYKHSPAPSVRRTRAPGQLRRICGYNHTGDFSTRKIPLSSFTVLKTGIAPSASGSAYLESEPSKIPNVASHSIGQLNSGLKLSCTVHGPRPLPRSTPFTPQLLLSARVKFTPSANRQRRGYIPDRSERDLAAHLETALRGILIGERWPKSGVDVIITVLESEEEGSGRLEILESMSILAGCITVASAAIAEAGIDCVDLVTGGVAATISDQLVLDPCPSDHEKIDAACVVAYLQSRDEITDLWLKGNIDSSGTIFESLIDNAIEAAKAARMVSSEALNESTKQKLLLSTLSSSKT